MLRRLLIFRGSLTVGRPLIVRGALIIREPLMNRGPLMIRGGPDNHRGSDIQKSHC